MMPVASDPADLAPYNRHRSGNTTSSAKGKVISVEGAGPNKKPLFSLQESAETVAVKIAKLKIV